MSLNKLIIFLNAVFASIILQGCADRHFIQLERQITNDSRFNSAEVVVVDLEFGEIDYTERIVSLNDSRVVNKGILNQNKKIIIDALSESLSFDGKSVFSLEQYQKIKKDLKEIRPAAGYKEPQLSALIRLKVSYGIQTGRYEREQVYGFYRKATRCQYLKNPPKGYNACQELENSTWDEIRLNRNASGLIDLWYSGDVYINENDQYTHHKSLNGYQLIETSYQDEKALNQSIAAGLGPIISNNIGTVDLAVRLEIDEGNHNDAIEWLKRGKIEVARKILEKDVTENMFGSSTDYYNLGLIYHTYGDFEIAIEYYVKAINAGGYKRMYVEALKNIKVLNEKSTL